MYPEKLISPADGLISIATSPTSTILEEVDVLNNMEPSIAVFEKEDSHVSEEAIGITRQEEVEDKTRNNKNKLTGLSELIAVEDEMPIPVR